MREVPTVRRALAVPVLLGLGSTATVVIQAVALGRLLAGAMPGAHPGDRVADLVWLGAAAGGRGLLALAGEMLARLGACRTKAELRARLLVGLLGAGPDGQAPDPGAVATLAGRGLDALDVYVGRCLPDLVMAVVAPVALTAAVGALDWLSALIVVAALALFPVFGALVGQASVALAAERWTQVEALGRQVTDVFEGLPVLKAFGRSAEQRARIEQAGDGLRRASLSTLRVAFLSALVLDTVASVSVALVAVPLGLRLLDGSVRLSAALAVLIIAPEVFLPLRRASAEFHDSTEGLAAATRAIDLISAGPHRSPRGAAPGSAGDPARVPVSLRSVRVEVPGEARPILDGADLTIQPGETVVLVGPNGAGKSTALLLLLGFVTASSGSVTVGEDDLRDLDLSDWRRRLAYLPEHPTLLAASLADNLRLANPAAPDEELEDAIRAVGASEFLAGLPGGLDTRIGDGGRPVSAGERQRIALARTLVRPASLYLLDEPTVHLDGPAEARAVAGLRCRLQGRSALIVTHRPAVAELADRVMTLCGGRFVEVGERERPTVRA